MAVWPVLRISSAVLKTIYEGMTRNQIKKMAIERNTPNYNKFQSSEKVIQLLLDQEFGTTVQTPMLWGVVIW